MGEFANRLQRMEEAWKIGRNAPVGVPDGVYTMQLQNAELRESNSGKMMVMRTHLITEGEFTGETVTDFIVLETEFGPRQLAEFIQIVGYEVPESVAEIEDIVASIANDAPRYTAAVKKSKDSDLRNVRIRQLIEGGGAAPAPAPKAKPAAAATPKAAPKAAAPAAVAKAAPVAAAAPVKKLGAPHIGEGSEVSFTDGSTKFDGVVKEVTKTGDLLVETADGDAYEVPASMVEVKAKTVARPALKPKAVAAPTATKDPTELIAFCQAHDLTVKEGDTVDQLIEMINKYEWSEGEVTKEEHTLLTGIGASFISV